MATVVSGFSFNIASYCEIAPSLSPISIRTAASASLKLKLSGCSCNPVARSSMLDRNSFLQVQFQKGVISRCIFGELRDHLFVTDNGSIKSFFAS